MYYNGRSKIINFSLKSLIESKKNIIFDFDGVLVDSVNIKADAFAYIYNSYGKKIINKVISHHLQNGGMSRFEKFKYYHKNFLDVIIDHEEIKLLSKKFSDHVIGKVVKAPEINGAVDFLNKFHNIKCFYINSATPTDEIIEIIRLKGWKKYFTKTFGSPSSKSENISKILSCLKNDNLSSCIFFGDARSDFIASKRMGIDFILIDNPDVDFPEKKEIKYRIKNFYPLI